MGKPWNQYNYYDVEAVLNRALATMGGGSYSFSTEEDQAINNVKDIIQEKIKETAINHIDDLIEQIQGRLLEKLGNGDPKQLQNI